MGSRDDEPKGQSAGALALAIIKRHVFKQTKDGPVVDQGIVDDIADALTAERATVERLERELAEARTLTRIAGTRCLELEQRLADAEAERDDVKRLLNDEGTSIEITYWRARCAAAEERAEQAEAVVRLLRAAVETANRLVQFFTPTSEDELTLIATTEWLHDYQVEFETALHDTAPLATALVEKLRAEVVEECAKVAASWCEPEQINSDTLIEVAEGIRALLSPAPRDEEGKP